MIIAEYEAKKMKEREKLIKFVEEVAYGSDDDRSSLSSVSQYSRAASAIRVITLCLSVVAH